MQYNIPQNKTEGKKTEHEVADTVVRKQAYLTFVARHQPRTPSEDMKSSNFKENLAGGKKGATP